MSKVVVDVGMSLDGFVAGPNGGPQNALGDGGDEIHRWVYDLESWRERQNLAGGQSSSDAEVFDESFANVGAHVMGRRMFDEGEVGWPDPPPVSHTGVRPHPPFEGPLAQAGRHDIHVRHRRPRERLGAGEGGRGR
jgi:dihydrofolate reductase